MAFFGKRKIRDIEPDEIFLDSRNIPEFDTQQFEGRLERPISRTTLLLLGTCFFLVIFLMSGRLAFLQVARGEEYVEKSEQNRLEEIPLFGDRGVIYDRTGVELAGNKESGKDFYIRNYRRSAGLGHLLGYVGHPKKDNRGVYWQKEVFGRDGVELEYDTLLKGEVGKKLVEIDARGNITSESLQKEAVNGENVTLSVDARVQGKLFELIEGLAKQVGFQSGAGVIMDVKTGELLSIVSYPEYDSTLLARSDGGEGDSGKISALLKDSRKPFLNRAVSGLYTPGSIVKPYVALGALAEGIISPDKEILSTGSISIPNPYFPDKASVFKDWKAHGWVDMRRAIAVSSDVYFYAVGGGFEDQKGLGIKNIEKYTKLFGLSEQSGVDLPGEVEGVVPNPDWKEKYFNGERWYLGDTYITAIGQYGFQVTPIQIVRAVASVANEGTLLTPHILMGDDEWPREEVDLDPEFFKIVKEGMRQGVANGGTAAGLNVPYVAVAGKTGTAELGVNKDFVNSWVTGFFPYESPRYAFAVVMERGPKGNTTGGVYIMRNLFDWMAANAPEYFRSI